MNIQEILIQLHKKMTSDSRIAEELGISQPTVFRLRTGKTSTSYETGLKIIELAKRHGIPDQAAA